MKKVISVLLILVLLGPAFCLAESTASENDYAFLDGMTLEELQALQDEVAKRIAAEKTTEAANNTNDLGMWEVKYYVDEFKNPTSEKYIANVKWIKGTFSNSAAENRSLNVDFLIDESDIAVRLYEYAGDSPVKVLDKTTYDVSILDSNNKKYTCTATEYSDRLYLPSSVLDILAQNGTISFYIAETGKYASSTYNFTIDDTSYFQNAYDMLSD